MRQKELMGAYAVAALVGGALGIVLGYALSGASLPLTYYLTSNSAPSPATWALFGAIVAVALLWVIRVARR